MNRMFVASMVLTAALGVGCRQTGVATKVPATPQAGAPGLPADVDPFGLCSPTGVGLTPGVTAILENYNAGGAPSYSASNSGCWRTFRSSLNPLESADHLAAFGSGTYQGTSANLRTLSITGRSGIESNAGVDYSPDNPPNTGWNSGQFGYLIELHRNRNCYANVTATVKLKANSQANAALYGVVVNGTVTGSGTGRKISGYFIHANGGGRTMTLAMYRGANDRAFDYIDQFPGSFGNPNPIVDGPYKGWDFAIGPYPAGGDPMGAAEIQIVTRYRHDFATSTTTLDWEMRPSSGVDGSPGVWDFSRTLTGSDSLAPAGGYGVYLTYYGGVSGPSGVDTLSVPEFQLHCANP